MIENIIVSSVAWPSHINTEIKVDQLSQFAQGVEGSQDTEFSVLKLKKSPAHQNEMPQVLMFFKF